MTLFDQRPSTLIRWVILALPALPMLDPLFGHDARALHRLLHPTGGSAARFTIIGIMASGLMLLFKGQTWTRWLIHHRRDIEAAAFIWTAVHALVYVIDRGTLDRIIKALPHTEIWTGRVAMLLFVPLAITSNSMAQRWMHSGRETRQRAAYPAAVLVLIPLAALHNWGNWPPAEGHVGPLLALWAYGLW